MGTLFYLAVFSVAPPLAQAGKMAEFHLYFQYIFHSWREKEPTIVRETTRLFSLSKTLPLKIYYVSLPSAIYLKEGGTSSRGRVSGRGCPALAISVRCMANTNSSAFSCPSPSISANDLHSFNSNNN